MKEQQQKRRTIIWYSCGAASAVTCKLTLLEDRQAIPVYCDTGSEHPDNLRFRNDCEAWFQKKIVSIRSTQYSDTWDVWARRRYLAGVNGAPCTVELKIAPRLLFQRPTDIHVFGYTMDASDRRRAERLRLNYPELDIRTPLIERKLSKSACLAIIRDARIEIPKMYRMGFPNNNCIPCVKATSPAYWALVRKRFPRQFNRIAKLSRKLGVRLCRIKETRRFIDEIPFDHPTLNAVAPSCDFLCHAAERDLGLK